MAKQASEFSKTDQNRTIFKICLLFGHFLWNTTCLMDKYLSRNQKIILKKYNKHVILPKNSQRRPSEKQNRSNLKNIQTPIAFWTLYGDKTCLRTNISQEIKRWPPKSVLSHIILQRKGPKSSQISNIVQFWSILLNSVDSFNHFLEI